MALIDGSLQVFSGTSNPELAGKMCEHLGIQLGEVYIHRFSNENIFVQIRENAREKDVFVVQTSAPPVNEGIMELLIMIDALRSASASRITAVIPYYPYARSDKKDQPRVSITARLIADLLKTAGADRVLTMTLHSPQIHGFFNIPVDHLAAVKPLSDFFKDWDLTNFVVVAPDAGSAKRAGAYAEKLKLPLAICDKRRIGNTGETEVVGVVGEVKGHNVIVFDDEVDTGGSLIETADAVLKAGAKEVHAGCAHAVLSGNAVERIARSSVRELVTTDTVPIRGKKKIDKIKIVSVADLFAEAIKRIHTGESISSLF